MDRGRKTGRDRERHKTLFCRVKQGFYKRSPTCPLAQGRLVNTAAFSPSSLKGVLAFAYPWVCVYSEWVSQEEFWSETHRSSGFEGDHPSTVSAVLASTQYVCVSTSLYIPGCCFPAAWYQRWILSQYGSLMLSLLGMLKDGQPRPVQRVPDSEDQNTLDVFDDFWKEAWSLLKVAPLVPRRKTIGIGRTLMPQNWRKKEIGIKIKRHGSVSRWLPETLPNTYKWGDCHGDNK